MKIEIKNYNAIWWEKKITKTSSILIVETEENLKFLNKNFQRHLENFIFMIKISHSRWR